MAGLTHTPPRIVTPHHGPPHIESERIIMGHGTEVAVMVCGNVYSTDALGEIPARSANPFTLCLRCQQGPTPL